MNGLRAKKVFLFLGAGLLAACEPVPPGATIGGIDSYFAVNVGRQAGRAEAMASLCPSLQFNTSTLAQTRAAICEGQGLSAGCALPTLDAEKQRLKATTLTSLSGFTSEQACAYAEAEAAADSLFAGYFIGLPVARVVAPVAVAEPAPVVEPEPEPEPDPEPTPEPEPEVVEDLT